MPVAAQVIPMSDSAEVARQQILDAVGPILKRSRFRPVGHDLLLAVYDRAGKMTRGGILIAENNREDAFQGKICLVLATGPMCREDRSPGYDAWFDNQPPRVGDWVTVSIKDGVSFLMGETTCRLVEWRYLRGLTDVHDLVM